VVVAVGGPDGGGVGVGELGLLLSPPQAAASTATAHAAVTTLSGRHEDVFIRRTFSKC